MNNKPVLHLQTEKISITVNGEIANALSILRQRTDLAGISANEIIRKILFEAVIVQLKRERERK